MKALLLIGLLAQAAHAVPDRTYIANVGNKVLEAVVTTEVSENETAVQVLTVIQKSPIVKQIPGVYILREEGSLHGAFDYGSLEMVDKGNRVPRLTGYAMPVNKKILLNVLTVKGEEILFRVKSNH